MTSPPADAGDQETYRSRLNPKRLFMDVSLPIEIHLSTATQREGERDVTRWTAIITLFGQDLPLLDLQSHPTETEAVASVVRQVKAWSQRSRSRAARSL